MTEIAIGVLDRTADNNVAAQSDLRDQLIGTRDQRWRCGKPQRIAMSFD